MKPAELYMEDDDSLEEDGHGFFCAAERTLWNNVLLLPRSS